MIKKYLLKSASYLCAACEYEMIRICIVMMFVFWAVNAINYKVEILIIGEQTSTWVDPFIVLIVMAYAALCAYVCAVRHAIDKKGTLK